MRHRGKTGANNRLSSLTLVNISLYKLAANQILLVKFEFSASTIRALVQTAEMGTFNILKLNSHGQRGNTSVMIFFRFQNNESLA